MRGGRDLVAVGLIGLIVSCRRGTDGDLSLGWAVSKTRLWVATTRDGVVEGARPRGRIR